MMVQRLPIQPAHLAIWVTSRTASPRCMRCRVGAFAHAVIRTQDQVGHTDVEPAMQPGLAAAHGVQPAEGNREAAQRFPLQVVVELSVVVAVQAGAVAAFNWPADHSFGAHSG